MMKMVDTQGGAVNPTDALPKQTLEINGKHPIIRSLSELSREGGEKEELAKLMAEQVFNNAIMSAGILDDARTMVPTIDKLLMKLVEQNK